MTRLILLAPFLAACAHTPPPCDVSWPRTCEERRDVAQDRPFSVNPQPDPVAERPVDVSPPASTPDGNGAETGDKPSDGNADRPRKHHSRDDNGDSSDTNGDDSHDD